MVLSSDRDTSFQQALGLYGRVDYFRLKGDGFDNLDSIYNALKKYNLVIASVHSTDIRSVRKYGISDCMIDIVDSLAQTGKLMLDVFADPYVLNRFHNLDKLKALVVSYENSSTGAGIIGTADLWCDQCTWHPFGKCRKMEIAYLRNTGERNWQA